MHKEVVPEGAAGFMLQGERSTIKVQTTAIS
jgi:hypothetical protein